MMVNCAGFLDRSRVNGPGERAVLWVQGCPLRCPGCFNRPLWSFRKNTLLGVDELADRILSLHRLDGVTFSGGEPFCQAPALAALGGIVRDCGLSVVTFSGYRTETLRGSRRRSWIALLGETDLLIAGPFVRTSASCTPVCGSSNQEAVYLSGRIPPGSWQCETGRSVEFTIGPAGEITTTGFPDTPSLCTGQEVS